MHTRRVRVGKERQKRQNEKTGGNDRQDGRERALGFELQRGLHLFLD